MRNRLQGQPDMAGQPRRSGRAARSSLARRDDGVIFQSGKWADVAGKFIGEHPAVCLAAAAVGGVLLGVLIKRRK